MSDSKRLQTDLVKVVDAGRRAEKRLGPRADASSIPSSVGSARIKKPSGAGTAGIASPLTEPDYASRTWHEDAYSVTSSDGTLSIVWDLPATIDLLDANDEDVQLILDSP
jgi:hypothetical protein